MYLSYLMGAENIDDKDLTNLGIEIVEKTDSGSRKLKIPSEKIEGYKNLILYTPQLAAGNRFGRSGNLRFPEYNLQSGNAHQEIT